MQNSHCTYTSSPCHKHTLWHLHTPREQLTALHLSGAVCTHISKADPSTDTSPPGTSPQMCKHTHSLLFLLLPPSVCTHICGTIPVQRCAHTKNIPTRIYSHTLTCPPSLLPSSAHPDAHWVLPPHMSALGCCFPSCPVKIWLCESTGASLDI